MKIHAYRIKPGEDLRKSIEMYAREHEIKAGAILTCVGSLQQASIRMANANSLNKKNQVKDYDQKFEIISLVGTISDEKCHLHISLSDKRGNVIGGHLKNGCTIYTTAEIVISEFPNLEFARKQDETTGFVELVVRNK
jgi:predicted DNA-binding protein with PD1-like motif